MPHGNKDLVQDKWQRIQLEGGHVQKERKSAVKSMPLYVCISRICFKFSYTCKKSIKFK